MANLTIPGIPWAIALAGVGLLVGASASLGAYYAFETGAQKHVALGLIMGGAALGGELLKPLVVAAAFDALGRWSLLRAAALFGVAAVCIVYSLASELGLAAASRGDLAAERRAASNSAAARAEERRRLEAELAAIGPARPKAEIDALVAAARPRCRIDVTLGGRNTVCAKDAKLLAEQGRAHRRAEIQAKLDALPVVVAAQKAADPLASAVAYYAKAAGYERLGEEDWSVWLYLLPVLLLELGSAFGGLVVAAYRPAPDRTESNRAELNRTEVSVRVGDGPPGSELNRTQRTEPNSGELSRTEVPNRAELNRTEVSVRVDDGPPGSELNRTQRTEPHSGEPSRTEVPNRAERTEPKRRGRRMTRIEAEQYLVTQLALNRELPSQDWLAERCGVGKSTVHDWVRDWQRRGLISRARAGKCNVIRAGKRLPVARKCDAPDRSEPSGAQQREFA